MTGTTKTILIVAGVGVGVFVLLKMLAPSPLASSKTKTISTGGTLQGLIGLGTAIAGAYSSRDRAAAPVTGYTSAPAPGNVPAYQAGESFDDYVSGMFGPGIPTYD